MDDSTRAAVLAAAEELFDRNSLYKLASSVGETRRRKSLRFWQEQMLAQLSQHVGIDVNSKSQFVAAFDGTAQKYATPSDLAQQQEIEKAKQQVKEAIKQVGKELRRIAKGQEYINPPGMPQEPLNRNAELIKFHVTFSLDFLVDSLLRALHDHPTDLKLHACCELIRAHHLGANFQTTELVQAIHESVNAEIEYFDIGKTDIDGWYRQLSNGIFLCAFCGLDDRLVQLCNWVTPRKRPEYQGTLDDDVQRLHLVLASLFQTKPATGFRRLLTNCLASRKTGIRLLASMTDAIIQQDQDAFEKSTRKAVENYRKRKAPDPNSVVLAEWLPVHINTAYHVGLRLGMAQGDFPDSVRAYLCGPFDGVENVK
jgi:hypothetical protein